MPVELVTVPCLSDNYAFLLHDSDSGQTALIDVPEAGPILAELSRLGWVLSDVWITHHQRPGSTRPSETDRTVGYR